MSLRKSKSNSTAIPTPSSSPLQSLRPGVDFYTSPTPLDPAIPTVIIFGWANGALKHVSKYADYYVAKGWNSIIILSKATDFLTPTQTALVAQMRLLVPVLQQAGVTSRSGTQTSIVQVFSNGGANRFSCLLQALDKQNEQLNLACLVIDSAPSRPDLLLGMKALTVCITNRALRCLAAICVGALLSLSFLLCTLLRIRWLFDGMWDAILRVDYRCPRVFLYSTHDALMPAVHVEQCIRQCQDLGLPTLYRRWDDSEHVRHMPAHCAEYYEIIEEAVKAHKPNPTAGSGVTS